MSGQPALRRSVTLPFLILYGMGTMVGAGFYALLGKVAAEAGAAAPLGFLAAGTLALLCGFSFAELSSRLPYSAGEAHYVDAAFGSRRLSALIGYLVVATGVVSGATLVVATVGFLQDFVAVPRVPAVIVLTAALGAVAAWGIGQSVAVITAITLATLLGLGYVLLLTGDSLAALPARAPELFRPGSTEAWLGVFAGGLLAFYAFIGFEDMVNIAEEVRGVRRNLPRAIVVSVVATTVIYVVVASAAVLTVPPAALAEAATPLARVVAGRGWQSTRVIGLISLIAGVNSALVQMLMAARVGYGLARDAKAPAWLAAVNPRTRTPLRATAAASGIVLVLALGFPLTTLAEATSLIILVVFATVCLALLRIRLREREPPADVVVFPVVLPVLGALAALSVLAFHFLQRP